MNFEDMMWLFTSAPHNRGIARLNIAEAALLWKFARSAKFSIIEIGRRHGGSTSLLVAAAGPHVKIVSVDKAPQHHPECIEWLNKPNVQLIDQESNTVEFTPASCDLAFIDGDHSYKGVSGDFQRIRPALVPGAYVLFHDAVPGSYGACEGVVKFTEEAMRAGWIYPVARSDSMLATRLI